MNGTKNEIINNAQISQIKQIVQNIIATTFPKLFSSDRNIFQKYVVKIILLASLSFYNDKTTFIQQITLNNNQDIYSLIFLLLPYYNQDYTKNIESFNEILVNKDNKAYSLESSYYIDHKTNPPITLTDYFINSSNVIFDTMQICKNKLYTNWLNVFPYTLENYKTSDIYLNYVYYHTKHSFNNKIKTINDVIDDDLLLINEDNFVNNNLILGYDTLLGAVTNFLYNDIKNIKWMIYDLVYNGNLLPTITVINDIFDNLINIICVIPYDKYDRKEELLKRWNIIIETEENYRYIKSLILFYLKWETDEDNIKIFSRYLDDNCKNMINIHTSVIYEDDERNDNNNERFIYGNTTNDVFDFCLKKLISIIKIERLYEYIFLCMQQFRYTWYSHCCLTDEKQIKDIKNYMDEYSFDKNKVIDNKYTVNGNNITKFTITPKNIYNYFKSLTHNQTKSNFTEYNSYQWISLSNSEQQDFINKLNGNNINSWFRITNNIKNLNITTNINDYQTLINNRILNTNLIPSIIFETLIINGILTFCKFNPKITDNNLLPSKTETAKRNNLIIANLEIKNYENSYHFLDNKKLSLHNNFSKIVGETTWFTNFGGDWMAQIQIFHHFINQRVMLITGGTGAGKSTVAPFMILYALKIVNYNNNCKVYCTQPRRQPVVANASRIAEQLGVPFIKNDNKEKKDNGKEKKDNSKYKADIINYVQFKHGADKNINDSSSTNTISDDYYHPTLCLITDGSLYNEVNKSFIFKKESPIGKDKITTMFTSKNILDVILVDEAHEHNTYMDMILTLAKFAGYINNQTTIGIISATMSTDEIIYRKYFKIIDDNWKYPLMQTYNYNRQLLDRRIHLSFPFGSVNYEIEMHEDLVSDEETILNHILTTTYNGDILIFQPGSNEINKLMDKINNGPRKDVYAIPFYADLNSEIRENIVKEIADPRIRNDFRIPKNRNINDYYLVKEEEKVPRGTYKRFVIIATNIAEASITINTLIYVIDTVWQKVDDYDIKTDSSKLKKKKIARTNSMQRRGRVGRVKPGVVYRMYNFELLNERVDYKICSSNIKTMIFKLITNELNKPKYLEEIDPYKKLNSKIPDYLKKQYTISEKYYTNNNPKVEGVIIYPYNDGKYDVTQLQDNEGEFYIIHPNEDDLIRDNVYDLKITGVTSNYENKIKLMMEYFEGIGLKDNLTGKNSSMGSMIDFYITTISEEKIKLELLLMFIDCVRITNVESIINKVLLFIVFSMNSIVNDTKNPKNMKIKKSSGNNFADFIVNSNIISDYNMIDINNMEEIVMKLNENIDNFDSVILTEINKIKEIVGKTLTSNFDMAKTIIEKFYELKIKLLFLTNNHLIELFLKHNDNPKNKKTRKKLEDLMKQNEQELTTKYLNVPMNEYEFLSYIIAKRKKSNVLLKVSGTSYYVNYYDRDINTFYELAHYNRGDTVIYNTLVDDMFRNNIILYIPSPGIDSNMITNIMLIPESVINIICKESNSDNGNNGDDSNYSNDGNNGNNGNNSNGNGNSNNNNNGNNNNNNNGNNNSNNGNDCEDNSIKRNVIIDIDKLNDYVISKDSSLSRDYVNKFLMNVDKMEKTITT